MFKPTPSDWRTIKTVALLGHDLGQDAKPIMTIGAVKLECRLHCNLQTPETPTHINAALVTGEAPIEQWSDCDLFDKDKMYTDQFRAGVQLTDDGRGIFDFYIYNRYDRDGDLAGNVLVDVVDGKMARIWIEGGKDVSWRPDTGIVNKGGQRGR